MFELLDILRYVVLPRDKYDMWVWSLEICGNYKKRLNGGISAHGWCSQIWRLENGSFEELSI